MANHYIDSIFYQVELTAKYCRVMGQQVFERYNVGVSVEEFQVLDTILCNKELCQRDLAKLIFKDRANTGKIVDSLEKKGLVARRLDIRNNRPVKMVELTNNGILKTEEVANAVRPHMEIVREKMKNTDLEKVSSLLHELRKLLGETLEITI